MLKTAPDDNGTQRPSIWLIQFDPQSPDTPPTHSRQDNRAEYGKTGIGVLVGVVLILAALPVYTHGGVFSLVTGTSSSFLNWSFLPPAEQENSQTTSLLATPRSIDPIASRGGGDITIIDDSALLSGSGPEGTLANIEEAPPRDGRISVYVVRTGDTLSGIAQMFDVSVNTIFWANNIKSEKDIHPGDQLIILPISGVQHTVKKGDTAESLAKKYQGNIEEILLFNNLSKEDTLTAGETITIPGGKKKTDLASTAKRRSSRSSSPSRPLLVTYNKSAPAGYYIHPVPGSHKTQGLHGYNGVDYGAPVGTTVRAAAPGTVIIARGYGWNGGYGKYVAIRHANGTQTLYGHLSAVLVSPGTLVSQGQAIGRMGSTGNSTGSHLHFEVRGAKNPF